MVAAGAFAQGTIVFNNRVTGTIVTHVYAPETATPTVQRYGNGSTDTPAGATVYTGAALSGAAWTAQLWAAPGSAQAEGSLVGSAQTTTFRTGSAAGFVAPTTATLQNVAPDAAVATIQMRVFPTSFGSWANALAAYQAGNELAIIGKSALFDVLAIGGSVNSNPNLVGLTSFSLMAPPVVPEPSSMALAGLGAASLLIFRRRK